MVKSVSSGQQSEPFRYAVGGCTSRGIQRGSHRWELFFSQGSFSFPTNISSKKYMNGLRYDPSCVHLVPHLPLNSKRSGQRLKTKRDQSSNNRSSSNSIDLVIIWEVACSTFIRESRENNQKLERRSQAARARLWQRRSTPTRRCSTTNPNLK